MLPGTIFLICLFCKTIVLSPFLVAKAMPKTTQNLLHSPDPFLTQVIVVTKGRNHSRTNHGFPLILSEHVNAVDSQLYGNHALLLNPLSLVVEPHVHRLHAMVIE